MATAGIGAGGEEHSRPLPVPPPIIVAHRGLHTELPENSLAAMTAAWDAGVLWCECDVQLSSDGIPIVLHDDTLDRTTTGRGRVADFSAARLGELRLLDFRGNPTAHRIPTLDELLDLASSSRRLLVETKQPMGERIIALAHEIQQKNGMLHSFHLEDLLPPAGRRKTVARSRSCRTISTSCLPTFQARSTSSTNPSGCRTCTSTLASGRLTISGTSPE